MDETLKKRSSRDCCVHGGRCRLSYAVAGNAAETDFHGNGIREYFEVPKCQERLNVNESNDDYVGPSNGGQVDGYSSSLLRQPFHATQRTRTKNMKEVPLDPMQEAGYYDLVSPCHMLKSYQNGEQMTKGVSKTLIKEVSALRAMVNAIETRQAHLESLCKEGAAPTHRSASPVLGPSAAFTSTSNRSSAALARREARLASIELPSNDQISKALSTPNTSSTTISYIGRRPEVAGLVDEEGRCRREAAAATAAAYMNRSSVALPPVYVDLGPDGLPSIRSQLSMPSSHNASNTSQFSKTTETTDLTITENSTYQHPQQHNAYDDTCEKSNERNPKIFGTMLTPQLRRRYIGTIRMKEAEQQLKKRGDFALYHKMQSAYDAKDLLAQAELTMVCMPDEDVFRHYRIKINHNGGENQTFTLDYGDPNSIAFVSLHDLVAHYKANRDKPPLKQSLTATA